MKRRVVSEALTAGAMCGKLQLSSAVAASVLVLCLPPRLVLLLGSVDSALQQCCALVHDLVQHAPVGTGGVHGKRAVRVRRVS